MAMQPESEHPEVVRIIRDYSKFDLETGEQVHNERGQEIPDPTPMQPPVGFTRQPSIAEQIRQMVRSEKLAQEAAAAGFETFEEADDLDVEDDDTFDRTSPYEANFDPMTDQERAALASQGRDVDRIVPPKPKKTSRPADQAGSVTEPAQPAESSGAEGGA